MESLSVGRRDRFIPRSISRRLCAAWAKRNATMKLRFRNQKRRLDEWLPEFRCAPFSFADAASLPETTFRERVGPAVPDLRELNLEFLFRYEVFPARTLEFAAEWQSERRLMYSGDVIVQQAFVPPFPWGVKLVFAVRVLDVVREKEKVGFSYGTLAGHPETGVNEFCFVVAENSTQAVVHTTAKPAHLIATLIGPVFTTPYVRHCNRQAVQCMKAKFSSANKDWWR